MVRVEYDSEEFRARVSRITALSSEIEESLAFLRSMLAGITDLLTPNSAQLALQEAYSEIDLHSRGLASALEELTSRMAAIADAYARTDAAITFAPTFYSGPPFSGWADASAPTSMEIDIQIYTSETSAGPRIEGSLRKLLADLGAADFRASDAEIGSWYRSLIAVFKQIADSDAGAMSKRAIEVQLLERFQAGVDGMTGNTVANILPALNGTRRAAIQIGSILIVKVDDTVVVRQLSPREMLHWRENPGLFKDPASALIELQRANNALGIDESSYDDAPAAIRDRTPQGD
jgi:uncharacterized protein YukE